MTNKPIATDKKDKEEKTGIVVTQNNPKESKEKKEEDKHPDGCCGSCS